MQSLYLCELFNNTSERLYNFYLLNLVDKVVNGQAYVTVESGESHQFYSYNVSTAELHTNMAAQCAILGIPHGKNGAYVTAMTAPTAE